MPTPIASTPLPLARALCERAALRSAQRLNAVNEVRAATIVSLCSADGAAALQATPLAPPGPSNTGLRLVTRLSADANAVLQIASALVDEGPRGAAQISTEMLTLNSRPEWNHAALTSLLALSPAPEHASLVAALVPTAVEVAALQNVLPWARHVRFARADGPHPDLLLAVAATAPIEPTATDNSVPALTSDAKMEAARALGSPLLAMFQDPAWHAAFVSAVERAALTVQTRHAFGQHVRPEYGTTYTDGSATLDYCGLRMIVTLRTPDALTLDIPIDAGVQQLWPYRASGEPPVKHVDARLMCARAADPTVAFADRINILALGSSHMGKALFEPQREPLSAFRPPFLEQLNADPHVVALGGVREMQVTYAKHGSASGSVLRLKFDSPLPTQGAPECAG